ncbi:MAG: ATP-binding protein [Chloroflexota bacterium]
MREKIVLSWSSGKDSAMALYELQRAGGYEVVSLLTVLTEDYDRVSMHGVRRTLLERQAEELGLPLEEVFISKGAANEEYERKIESALIKFKNMGVSSVVFGDIFLQDIRKYREDNLARVGMKAIFPNWGRDTGGLVRESIRLGFKAVITCVDTRVLGRRFAGRLIDGAFLAEIPEGIDPAGENGEYHSFVFAGPVFRNEVPIAIGECVLRDQRFYFCDLLPV